MSADIRTRAVSAFRGATAARDDVVTTVEQLDALPPGTVIIHDRERWAEATGPTVYQKWDARDVGHRWVSPTYDPATAAELIIESARPEHRRRFRVVWRP